MAGDLAVSIASLDQQSLMILIVPLCLLLYVPSCSGVETCFSPDQCKQIRKYMAHLLTCSPA